MLDYNIINILIKAIDDTCLYGLSSDIKNISEFNRLKILNCNNY